MDGGRPATSADASAMVRPSVVFAVCRRSPRRRVFGNGIRSKAGPSSISKSSGSTKQPRAAP
eukprot:12169765-Alexandrium_andersonii.AAC.1